MSRIINVLMLVLGTLKDEFVIFIYNKLHNLPYLTGAKKCAHYLFRLPADTHIHMEVNKFSASLGMNMLDFVFGCFKFEVNFVANFYLF